MRRLLAAVLPIVLASCAGSPILANPPAIRPSPSPASSASSAPRPADPRPIRFPTDEAAHDRLTEWWYVTGHLVTPTGRRFGFEDVVFRAERGAFPVSWASHLALTDEQADRFLYAQRSEVGPQADRTAEAPGSQLALAVTDPSGSPGGSPAAGPWTVLREAGGMRLSAAAPAPEVAVGGRPASAGGGTAFGLDLALRDSPPILHGTDGWIDFGPAGGSYYYSRTRMPASGTVTLAGTALRVTGEAWFDHQWGDFISVGGGGWDWFAVNLDDGTDVTLSLVRAADGTYPLVYGTLVRADRRVVHLQRSDFAVSATGQWTSAATGATYPAGWRITLPAEDLTVVLRPTVAAQELDTRSTTGVTYWEGSQRVAVIRGARARSNAGEAYVELTGYAPG